jgi:hypothetical protein
MLPRVSSGAHVRDMRPAYIYIEITEGFVHSFFEVQVFRLEIRRIGICNIRGQQLQPALPEFYCSLMHSKYSVEDAQKNSLSPLKFFVQRPI